MADRSGNQAGPRKSIWANLATYGTGLYLYVSLIAMIYSYSYYGEFDINIFNFSSLPDFLLIALSDLSSLIEAAVLVLLTAAVPLLLIFVSGRLFSSSRQKKPNRPKLEEVPAPLDPPELPDSKDEDDNEPLVDRVKRYGGFLLRYGGFLLRRFFIFFLRWGGFFLRWGGFFLRYGGFLLRRFFVFTLGSLTWISCLIFLGLAFLVPWHLGKWNSHEVLKVSVRPSGLRFVKM